MVQELTEEVARRHPKPPLMVVHEADNIASGRVRLILVARDDPL
jgi:hypothetical protein